MRKSVWHHQPGWGFLALWVIVLVLSGFSLGGCQTVGNIVRCPGCMEAVCPICNGSLRTTPLAGFEYTTCICPACGKRQPDVWDGCGADDTVYICDRCKAVMATCPHCRMATRK